MFACTTFRVGGMQLNQLIYIIGSNLAISRRVKMASAFAVASQFRMEKSRNVDIFCRTRISGMSLEKVLLGVILLIL